MQINGQFNTNFISCHASLKKSLHVTEFKMTAVHLTGISYFQGFSADKWKYTLSLSLSQE
jgi:hypothetical protein